jgi:uncharacterized protein (DUF2249 family)
MNDPIEILDGRAIPCSVKHGLIAGKCCALPVGGTLELVNDHDPANMRRQFAGLWPGTFEWKYLEPGPETFRIQITKPKPLPEGAAPDTLSCGH